VIFVILVFVIVRRSNGADAISIPALILCASWL